MNWPPATHKVTGRQTSQRRQAWASRPDIHGGTLQGMLVPRSKPTHPRFSGTPPTHHGPSEGRPTHPPKTHPKQPICRPSLSQARGVPHPRGEGNHAPTHTNVKEIHQQAQTNKNTFRMVGDIYTGSARKPHKDYPVDRGPANCETEALAGSPP